jgi:hypothetical protein
MSKFNWEDYEYLYGKRNPILLEIQGETKEVGIYVLDDSAALYLEHALYGVFKTAEDALSRVPEGLVNLRVEWVDPPPRFSGFPQNEFDAIHILNLGEESED